MAQPPKHLLVFFVFYSLKLIKQLLCEIQASNLRIPLIFPMTAAPNPSAAHMKTRLLAVALSCILDPLEKDQALINLKQDQKGWRSL
jgi:hypothetical protein